MLVVSDTHFSDRTPEAAANWAAVVRYAEGGEASLVVHVGDLTRDGATAPLELVDGRRRLDQLGLSWMAVPGNHDIGDNPGVSAGPNVDSARVRRWREAIGSDYWARDVRTWTLVGLDAQLFGSGTPEEEEQAGWLSGLLDRMEGGRFVALFLHKPLFAMPDELNTSPSYRFLPPAARQQLAALFDGRSVPVVVSGHVHQYRTLREEGRMHVWAPTTWAVLPEDIQETVGTKRCGVAALQLDDDGSLDVKMVEPPGAAQLMLGRDVADPYVHY